LRAKLGKRFVPTISKPVRLKPINLQITLRRQEELYDHRVISVQDLINAQDTNRTNQANLDAAKSKVVSAEAQLLAGQAQVRTFQALAQSLQAQEKRNAGGH
jgi:multidrug resistance efflux pump